MILNICSTWLVDIHIVVECIYKQTVDEKKFNCISSVPIMSTGIPIMQPQQVGNDTHEFVDGQM